MQIDATSYPSPNYNSRPGPIRALVLHDGEGTMASDMGRLRNDKVAQSKRVSAHYYVDRQGTIYQLVDPSLRAWHAGESSYLGLSNWNDFSIGVETEHKDGQDWPDVQRQQIAALFRYLINRYHIPQPYVAPHRWIATGRKFDPTNWPDEQLRPWIASLYGPSVDAPIAYRFRFPQVVYTARDENSPVAAGDFNGGLVYQAGDVVQIGDIASGWAWIKTGQGTTGPGFVPLRVLEAL